MGQPSLISENSSIGADEYNPLSHILYMFYIETTPPHLYDLYYGSIVFFKVKVLTIHRRHFEKCHRPHPGATPSNLRGGSKNSSKLKMVRLPWNLARTKARVCSFWKCINFHPTPYMRLKILWSCRQGISRQRVGVGGWNLVWKTFEARAIMWDINRCQGSSSLATRGTMTSSKILKWFTEVENWYVDY